MQQSSASTMTRCDWQRGCIIFFELFPVTQAWRRHFVRSLVKAATSTRVGLLKVRNACTPRLSSVRIQVSRITPKKRVVGAISERLLETRCDTCSEPSGIGTILVKNSTQKLFADLARQSRLSFLQHCCGF